MPSLEASIAAMSKTLESQLLIAQVVTEAGRIMDPNSVAGGSAPAADLQTEVSAAITGLGKMIDLVV